MRIAYFCLSDLHLGEEDSLLTNIERKNNHWIIDACRHSPVMESFLKLLSHIKAEVSGGDPMGCLVLNGDIFELAFNDIRDAISAFRLFLDAIVSEQLFDSIIYIPGNHDHHLWEQTREEEFVKGLSGGGLPEYFHTVSPDRDAGLDSSLLGTVCGDAGISVKVHYPLLNLKFDATKRNFFIHHGHLHSREYLFMSYGMDFLFEDHSVPTDLESLEKDNFAWIDFIWSALGRSGSVGGKVEYIYESLGNEKSRCALADQVAKKLAAEFEILSNKLDILPWTSSEELERAGFRKVIQFLMGLVWHERHNVEQPISEGTRTQLKHFLDNLLTRHVTKHLGQSYLDDHRDWLTHYIFGHTHKPARENLITRNLRNVYLLNTGGWVLERGEKLSNIHGGAITLISEEGKIGHVHLFNQAGDPNAPDMASPFGDWDMKHALSQALRNSTADEFIEKVRRAIAIRWERPPQ